MPMDVSLFKYIRSLPEENINFAGSGMKGINPDGNGNENVEELISKLYGIKSDNVLVTPSGTFASFFTLFFLKKKIRKMITIKPEYPVFYYQARELEIDVEMEERMTEDGVELSPWDVEENAVYFLSNPNNPSGMVWSDESLRSIARETEGNDSYLVVDDTFAFFTSSFSKKMDIGNSIMIGSVSKFFGESGIKLGWIAARDSIIKEMRESMDMMVPDISLAVRKRASYLLSNIEMYRDYNSKKLKTNYAILKESLGDYLVDSPAQIINALYINESSMKFSQSLLRDGISTIPGIFFGYDNIVRVCIGAEEPDRVERGAKVISKKLVNGKQ